MSLSEKSQQLRAEANRLDDLIADFPQLQQATDRWGKQRYYAPSVNAMATDFELKHDCGCCSDSPLFVWPFLITGGNQKVFSSPPSFLVGEGTFTGGDVSISGWESRLQDAQIPEPLIARLRVYFDEQESRAADESVFGDDE